MAAALRRRLHGRGLEQLALAAGGGWAPPGGGLTLTPIR